MTEVVRLLKEFPDDVARIRDVIRKFAHVAVAPWLAAYLWGEASSDICASWLVLPTGPHSDLAIWCEVRSKLMVWREVTGDAGITP